MHGNGGLLLDSVIYLGFALVAVLLFRRLGLGATLGYLVAGALIGPHGLGLLGNTENIMALAEIGIVLLLFIIGLELHPSRLMRLRRDIFGLGLAQVVVSGILLAAGIYFVTGFSLGAAIAVGLPLALSSTAQVLPMLQDRGRLNTPFGERAFSILLFQDLSIVPLITIIAALSRAPVDPAAPPGWQLAIHTVLAVAGLVLAGRFVLNPLFRLIGRIGARELFVVAGLFTVLAAAAIMEALHLSAALGAFVAGVMLADSPYRHELEADIEPFRSLLLGLFFVGVGMMLDVDAVVSRPHVVLGLAVLVIAIKTLAIWSVARMFGMRGRSALSLGLLLSQGGEFGFVLFAQASDALLIAPEAASLFGAVVTLSMASTPLLMTLVRRFNREDAPITAALDGPENAGAARAIVIGYGRVGQTVAQMIMAQGASVTVIDSNPEQIERTASFGMKVYYGDGSRVDLLRRAGAEEANLIVYCVNGEWLGASVIEAVRQAFPQAAVLARVFDRRHLLALEGAELNGMVREVWESAILLGRMALEKLGVEGRQIDRIDLEYRRRDEERLALQSVSGDLHSGNEMMFHRSGPLPAATPVDAEDK
ncbi:sodium:proton exchanger [Tardibacter chloracetimidivorans]|uniref:Sodium:proton exchanger n=1 Tax=Tardibacter chloracetimidivorans TaxID=1921510 RepID=A0A1L3ZVD2_9SPHN|nr:monovalent cation:proton antiporter-2 (CPA2) family protein [Tardibacter chloracetimidivorans]API59575.1 sodium:proton exchanger [Tardibacter chloracetimidivorans]